MGRKRKSKKSNRKEEEVLVPISFIMSKLKEAIETCQSGFRLNNGTHCGLTHSLKTFYYNGTDCYICGLKGRYFKYTRKHGLSLVGVYRGQKEVLLNADHVIPRSKGGADPKENRITACEPCNNKKADNSPANVYELSNYHFFNIKAIIYNKFPNHPNIEHFNAFFKKCTKRLDEQGREFVSFFEIVKCIEIIHKKFQIPLSIEDLRKYPIQVGVTNAEKARIYSKNKIIREYPWRRLHSESQGDGMGCSS